MFSGNQGRQNSILLDDDIVRWFFSQSPTSYQQLINNVLTSTLYYANIFPIIPKYQTKKKQPYILIY